MPFEPAQIYVYAFLFDLKVKLEMGSWRSYGLEILCEKQDEGTESHSLFFSSQNCWC